MLNNSVEDTLSSLSDIAKHSSTEMNLERLFVGLRSLVRWPPGGRRAVISPTTMHDILQKVYENIKTVRNDDCPMHCDGSAVAVYEKECKVEFDRLGVTAVFSLHT